MTLPAPDAPPAPPPPPSAPPGPRLPNRLGLAALIVGVVAVMMAVIPFACYVAGLPAIVALVLGIVAVARSGYRKRTAGIVGIVLGVLAFGLAIVLSIVYTLLFVASAANDGSLRTLGSGPLASLLPSGFPTTLPTELPTDLPSASSLASAPTTGPGGSVTFTVTGSGTAEQIEVIAATGASVGQQEVDDVRLPWTKTVGLAAGGTAILSITVDQNGAGTLACSIAKGGKVLTSASRQSGAPDVSCSTVTG